MLALKAHNDGRRPDTRWHLPMVGLRRGRFFSRLISLSSHFAYEICKFSDVGNPQRSTLADNQAKQVQPT